MLIQMWPIHPRPLRMVSITLDECEADRVTLALRKYRDLGRPCERESHGRKCAACRLLDELVNLGFTGQ